VNKVGFDLGARSRYEADLLLELGWVFLKIK
jgi:hypothetical protein